MLQLACSAALLRAQPPQVPPVAPPAVPPAAQDPQAPGAPVRVDAGSRQDPGGEVVVNEAVRRLEGKNVRAIRVARAASGGAPRLLDEASADPLVRGLATRTGQPFDARKVTADCGSLWSNRRLVVRAEAQEVDGEVVVTFLVEREVKVYAGVEWKGLRHFDRATVDSLLGITRDRQVTSTEAEAMRKVLLARYRRDGYAYCSVELDELPLEDGPSAASAPNARTDSKLLFRIDEGPKVTVRSIRFVGNASFASEPVLGLFGADDYLTRDAHIQSDPAWGFLGGAAYSREVLDEDLDRLRLFYRGQGFLDATVDLADVQPTPDRDEVDVTCVVVEGPRYKIRSVRVQHVDAQRRPIAGAPRYPAEQIERDLKVKAGEYYDFERLQRDWLQIQDFYGKRGHPQSSFPGMRDVPDACVAHWPPREVYGTGPEVDIVFEVFEGEPKRLRDVVIRGNRSTRDAVIRRQIRVLPGQTIDMTEVNRSLRRLEQTRFFQDSVTMAGPRLQLEPVAVLPGEVRPNDLVNLAVEVQEGDTGELRWGVGVSTGQGVQGSLSFNKRNFDLFNPPSSPNPITVIGEMLDNRAFHGGGQNLNMLLAPGSRFSTFAVTWIEPDVFGEHFDTHELRVTGQRRIRRLPDGYTSDTLGAEVGLSRNFTEHWNAGIAARHETVEVRGLAPDATQLAFDAEGDTELRGLRLSTRYRDYDDFLRPTEGIEIGASFEVVGGFLGGEESLTKLQQTLNLYVPLRENEVGHRTVLHIEHFFGLANEFGGSDDVFLTERFYMGGANLRGFDFRGAGPSQFGRPLGGEIAYTATAEVFFPLVATRLEGQVRDRELLRGVLFTDIGFLGLGPSDPSFGELRGSSGFGLRIEVPYLELPIALDLGWPWAYEETDDRRQFFFSISP